MHGHHTTHRSKLEEYFGRTSELWEKKIVCDELGRAVDDLDLHSLVSLFFGLTRHVQVGDMIDMHNYVGPGSPIPTETRTAVLGEFGGLGRRIEVC